MDLEMENPDANNSLLPDFFGSDVVLYVCSCKKRMPLQRLYFCRHCVEARCGSCASHEVDSQYCQHCLEYIPTIDGKLKKNKCSTCYSCPSCGHTLSTRASVTPERKSFYLICLFCKWTSRESGIPDADSQSAAWPEPENTPENEKRIRDLFAYYKALALKDKAERDQKRISSRTAGHAIHLLDKYGISAGLSPKVSQSLRDKFLAKSSPAAVAAGQVSSLALQIEPSVAVECPFERPDYEKLRTEKLDVSAISSLDQRLRQIETQPIYVKDFRPVSQMLSVKKSVRCKKCEHNLCKPECNPSSIKFKILLSAYYYLPEIRIKQWTDTFVFITIQNPTSYDLNVRIEPSKHCSFQPIDLLIPAKDETLDIDLGGIGSRSKDPNLVSKSEHLVKADGHKLTLKLPYEWTESGCGSEDVPVYDESEKPVVRRSIVITVRHDFIKTLLLVPGSEKREPQIESVTQTVLITEPQKNKQ